MKCWDGHRTARGIGYRARWFEDSQDIGLLIVSHQGHAGGSNRSMAWSTLTGG